MPPLKLTRALKQESALRSDIHTGMGAIARKHHSLIADDQRERIVDSIDLDAATKLGREQEHRWDYLVAVSGPDKLVAIEPHTASSDKEIRVMVQKKNNAVELLREELRPGLTVASWHWVTTKVGFSRMEPALRALNQSGIKFHGRLIRNLD